MTKTKLTPDKIAITQERLDSASVEDIIGYYENQINKLKIDFNSNSDKVYKQETTRELFESFKETPVMGGSPFTK